MTFKKSYAAVAAVLVVLVAACAAAVLLAGGDDDTQVSGVSLDRDSAILVVGGTTTLVATVSPSDASDQSVTWSSSDESVATVDEDGLVTGVSEGTATVTATTADGGYTAACAVTVVGYDESYVAASLDTGYLMLTLQSADLVSEGTMSSVDVTSGASTVKVWDSEDGGLTVEITGVPVEDVTSVTVSFSGGEVLYGLIYTFDGLAYIYADPSASGGVDFAGAWVEAVAYLCDGSSSLDWSYWGGSTGSYGVSDSATVTEEEDMVELWSIVGSGVETSSWTTPGSAICIDSYTYYFYNSVLYCVETLTGDIIATASCPSSSVYNMALAYGDGMVFVPTKSGSYTILRAFDATTLEQLFVSVACEGGEVQGSITYYQGCVYFGTYSGGYYCFAAEDTDTGSDCEEISPLWVVSGSGWYNATPAFFDNLCVIAEKGYDIDGAVVYLVDTATGAILDTVTLPYAYCTSGLVAYNGRVYVATSASLDGEETTTSSSKVMRIYSFVVADGQIDDDSVIIWESDTEGGGTQSTPVIYNNRLYIGGGGSTLGSNEPFTVLDIAEDGTMTLAYTVDLITKGTASLTTYYATVENDGLVYIYLMEYGHVNTGEDALSSSGYAYIYCLSDCAGQTEANIVFTYLPSTTQFAYQSFTISPEGCLLIRNDVALFCYAPATSEYSASAVYNAIERIVADSEEGEVSYAEVARVEERYAALSDEDKALVTNYGDLQALYVTVTFVYGDATVVSKVLKGSLVVAPSVGSTDSLVFDCWMDGDEAWDVSSDRVTGDVTLTAAYSAAVTVTFDSDGGTDVDSVTVAEGGVIGYVEDPTRDGYTFGGWYCGGVEYVAQYSTVDSDITLTALWLKDSTIYFDSNGGEDVDSISVTYTYEIGDLPTPTRSGYSFLGWYYNGELFEDTVYLYECDITLTAMWSANSTDATVDNGYGVYATGTFPDDATMSVALLSATTSSTTALKSASGDDDLECYMIQVKGDGVDGATAVVLALPVGTAYDGQTLTVWYYVSSTVYEASGTVEDGYLTVTVYGATSSSKVQIVLGITAGTELSSHTGSSS